MAEWRLVYGAGANPPLFTWLAKLVDGVLGHPVAAVELVRFAMLWLFCLLTGHTVRAMTGDGRLAALAGLSAFAIYAVGWETLFRYTNTMMLIASIPLTLAALLRLDRDNGAASYVLLAVVSAFGFYGKHTYDVVWIAFGNDRVIYGSNWPVSDRGADYYTLQRIVMEYADDKGEDATKKFCSLNAKRAYKWVERAGRR